MEYRLVLLFLQFPIMQTLAATSEPRDFPIVFLFVLAYLLNNCVDDGLIFSSGSLVSFILHFFLLSSTLLHPVFVFIFLE